MPISIAQGYVCVSTDDDTPSPQNSWVAKTMEAGGKTFLYCDKTDRRFAKLVNNDFRMLSALTKARNVAVKEKMAA
eukprot:4523605-Pyramimonas_sp.AAC.1